MKYKSDIFKVIHKDAKAMFKVGAITKEKLLEFDEMCLKNPKTKKQTTPVYTDDNSAETINREHATA